jgi:hypothetical protein
MDRRDEVKDHFNKEGTEYDRIICKLIPGVSPTH